MRPTIDLNLFELPVYTVLVMLGAGLGLFAACAFLRVRSRHATSLPVFLDSALIVFAAGWIGARAYHVAMHWDYYAARPEEIAQLGLGGLGTRGAFIAGLLSLAIYARARGLRFGKLADAAAFGLALGQAVGWVGALVQGANYGVVSDSLIALDQPDLYGLIAPRFPLQHVEIILFASLFVGLFVLALQKPRAGTLFLVYLLVTSAANFVLGFQRGDETAYIGVLRADQVVDVALGILALAGWMWWAVQREGNVG